LEKHLECGVYPRARMARQIAMEIAVHLNATKEDVIELAPITEGLRSLVRAIVASKKSRPQILRACGDIKSWRDVNAIMRAYANIRWGSNS